MARILELVLYIGDYLQTRKKMVVGLWDYLWIGCGGSDRSGMCFGCLGVMRASPEVPAVVWRLRQLPLGRVVDAKKYHVILYAFV